MSVSALPIAFNPVDIPDYLIKEVIDGYPVYYKGYRDVLKQIKTPPEIMGDGLLQAIIKSWLQSLLIRQLQPNQYWVLAGEVGAHVSHKNNMAHDLMVIDKRKLPPSEINNRYARVPADLVIEIDTEVEFGTTGNMEQYVQRKTQNALDFGVGKVVWFFTETQKVMVATSNTDWSISAWNKTIDLLDGVQANMAEYLASEGIVLDNPGENP